MPLLAVLRFPEKFAVLAVLALVLRRRPRLAAAARRAARRGGREAADLPLALAVVALATALAFALLLLWAPRAALWLHRRPRRSRPRRAAARPRGLAYLRAESWAARGDRGGGRRPARPLPLAPPLPARCWRRLAVALLAADLWHYGHGLVRDPAGRRLHGAAAARGVDPPRRGPGLRAAARRRRARDRAARLGETRGR